MKNNLSKIIGVMSIVGIMMTTGGIMAFAYSEEDASILMQEKTSVHHFDCEEINEIGRDERTFYVTGSTNSDIHNKAKLHYYNATSEPVKIYIGDRELIVGAWSSNELYMSVSHGQALCAIIIGENRSSTQPLKGYLSVKSYNDKI
ncbi:MAG: hypothetical protein R3Y29_05835 [bacterium]